MAEGSEQVRAIEMLDASPISMDFSVDWEDDAVLRPSSSDDWQKRISRIGWLSAALLHDLRNPLGAVVAGAEMLMELDPASIQVKRLAANIHRAAGRMRELLADVAGASQGNRSRTQVCKLRDVITAASEAALPAAEEQSVRIANDVSHAIRLPLDRVRVEYVFFNLIRNSIEAMPRGGHIRMGARQTDHYVLIEVEDTGPGISVGISDRLFEPFVTSGKDHGMGLGLALSRQTVLDHGGDLWIEPAAGARFVVRLPLSQIGSVLVEGVQPDSIK